MSVCIVNLFCYKYEIPVVQLPFEIFQANHLQPEIQGRMVRSSTLAPALFILFIIYNLKYAFLYISRQGAGRQEFLFKADIRGHMFKDIFNKWHKEWLMHLTLHCLHRVIINLTLLMKESDMTGLYAHKYNHHVERQSY